MNRNDPIVIFKISSDLLSAVEVMHVPKKNIFLPYLSGGAKMIRIPKPGSSIPAASPTMLLISSISFVEPI